MKKLLLSIFVFLSWQCSQDKTENSGFESSDEVGVKLILNDPIQDKIFYVLSLFQGNDLVNKTLSQDQTLKNLKFKYKLALKSAEEDCFGDVECIDQLMQFKEGDIEAASEALNRLSENEEFGELMEKYLAPSGLYQSIDGETNSDLLTNAFENAMRGINKILEVYGLGKSPRYPEIDRLGYQPKSPEYRALVAQLISEVFQNNSNLFFEPSLRYAIGLLEINNRDEAGRYEPLQEGANKKALDFIKEIDWGAYEYSSILVLGDSPNSPGDMSNISVGAMQRTDRAVTLFNQAKAPLIVFSGGHLRPFQTPYAEAVEMKKYAMDKYDINEKHILIDPQARHTTTNFRNASRIIFRYALPTDKKAIATTSSGHSNYVTSQEFVDRCLAELGYVPIELVERLNAIEVAFIPLEISLRANPMDPLDP